MAHRTCPRIDLTDAEATQLATLHGACWPRRDRILCDLHHDHEGPHAACAQQQESDHDDSITYWWVWWDEASHRVETGPRCAACAEDDIDVPVGHEGGCGFLDEPGPPTCDSAVTLTAREVKHFGELPDANHQVEARSTCDLDPEHGGSHVCLVQSQDSDAEVYALWWATWDREGDPYQIAQAPECSASGQDAYGEEVPCLHREGHGGGHCFL